MDTVALELHASSNIWNPQGILDVLGLMQRTGMDTLVLHEVGILERLVYPSRYFGADPDTAGVHRRYQQTFRELYRYDPGRRSRPYQNLEYLRWVARRAAAHGIGLYLNNKELFFPDAILEFQPQLSRNGHLCPTDPFWTEFLRVKYDELFTDFPELAGTITAPGTGESRLSLSGNLCDCERCAATRPADWFAGIVLAMHEPAHKHGKNLVLRDFVFDRATQDELAAAIEDLPRDVVVCLKNTPHDYYPTFPHNPRIGDVGERTQWVEVDSMGQYYGWGIAVAALVEDYRSRLEHAAANGVTGVLVRVDWEGLEGHSSLQTPNRVNLHALGLLAADRQTPAEAVYDSWARDVSALREDIARDQRAEGVAWLAEVMGGTWPVVARMLYAKGCVLSDSSQFPVSVEHAYWLAEEKNSLQDWDDSAVGALDPGAANVRTLLAEKDEAVDRCARLLADVERGHPALAPAFHGDLVHRFRTFHLYADTYRLAAHAVFLGRHIAVHGAQADPDLVARCAQVADALGERCALLASELSVDWYPASTALSADRLRCLHDDVQTTLANSRAVESPAP